MRIFLFLFFAVVFAGTGHAFCGFYVARADGDLFNKASKVIMVRDGRKTVITMASDYRGAAKDFAMIVPSPKVLQRNQIRTVKPETVAHLDAYTAPRLVEYEDWDPCEPDILIEPVIAESAPTGDVRRQGARALGVTVKAEYAVGVYDIAILKARESDGLVTYLRQEGYQIPDGAELVLADYIADKMKFFVARVNLSRHNATKSQELPPLQIAFRSPKFMLPLQLGKINSDQDQSVLLMTLTKKGRVEAANYKNTRIPSDVDVPVFVEQVFGQFYEAVFNKVAKANTVVTEYAWDMGWCDPCAADPLSFNELRELGVTWAKRNATAQDVFVTRMHFKYTANEFARDLLLKVTNDKQNFQGRYVMNHPWAGPMQCQYARETYIPETRARFASEAAALHKITGWSKSNITTNIRKTVPRAYRY